MTMEHPPIPSAPTLERERGTFVFFSYAHQDKRFRDKLEDHLSNLKYRGLIATWHDREIRAGEEWAQQIDIYLNTAHIILLLISSDFMASEYCYSIEMKRAMERHEQMEADVIPILLRPVLYTDAPFAKLQMLPANGKPIVRWRDRDSAFVDIAYGIETIARKYLPPLPSFTWTSPEASRFGSVDDEAFQTRVRLQRSDIAFVIVIGAFVVGLIIASILALLQHPTLVPLVIYLFIGLLLLITGVVAVRKVIGAIRARREQRRAREALSNAHRRGHDNSLPSSGGHQDEAVRFRKV